MNKSISLEPFLYDTDSYKLSHWLQYPPGTEYTYFYLEAREGGEYPYTQFFGLKYILDQEFSLTKGQVVEAEHFYKKHGVPFNTQGFYDLSEYITEHKALPIRVYAVNEGAIYKLGTPLVVVVNTDPRFYWLPSFLETMFMRVWYPCTVATTSLFIKSILREFHQLTSDAPVESLDFKLHDFGSRGVSSRESAAIGGAAHLVNFKGTDTTIAIRLLEDYYGAFAEMPGFSIPAMEHSTVTAWSKDNEAAAYENMLKQFAKPGAILACVSDSYDLHNAVKNIWCGSLRQAVIDSGATVVIRPDSGYPPDVVLRTLDTLADSFGCTKNSKGYKVLNNVRVIQGDGINDTMIRVILFTMQKNGYAIDNIAFGMGGALLQKVDRDVQRFAYKCSGVCKDGQWYPVQKIPATDPTKASKAGIDLHMATGMDGGMDCVYFNGPTTNRAFHQSPNINNIRNRAAKSLDILLAD